MSNDSHSREALIVGARGTVGAALAAERAATYAVTGISRAGNGPGEAGPCPMWYTDYSEADLQRVSDELSARRPRFDVIVCCIGVLHGDRFGPERRLADLQRDTLLTYFEVNAVLPALVLRFFAPLLRKDRPATCVALSAMVGSIADNRLGGWYGYRASKAALNMLVKTAAIEVARSNAGACLAALHPGTTRGPLSAPFTANTPPDKLYTPGQSARRIANVIAGLTPADSGGFFNWDGSVLPW